MECIGEGIDRLITIDFRARGVIYRLYEAARKLCNSPLTLTAAQQIADEISKGDHIILTTGFILPPNYIPESDGPSGAVALARALKIASKAKPIFITEEKTKEILLATLNAVDMQNMTILNFPLKLEEAETEAEEILEKYNPSLIVAIEKPGRNDKGEYHTMKGINISAFHAKIEPLIEKANRQGILTIGIGDGGNEIGMGNIKGTVEEYVPYAKECQCPCEGGIAAESKVDLLVTASVSNWGAYGIEACIEAITGKEGILHSPEIEENMLKSLFEAGAVDGASGQKRPLVDGVPHRTHSTIISMLKTLISAKTGR